MGILDSLFGSKPTTTSSTSQPWTAAQPALKTALGAAENLYKTDTGYKPYTGATQADLSGQSQQALDQTQALAAGQGGLLGQTNYNFANGLVGQNGMSPDMVAALQNMSDTASGKFLQTPNPYLQQMMDANDQSIMNRVNGAMSAAGRYGSGAHTATATRELANANNQLLGQNYENERARQLAASQGLGGMYGEGLNRSLQAASLGAGLTDQLYNPAQRLAAVGSMYDTRAQNNLDSQINLWNSQQARPWEQVARLNAIASGAGQLGGTQTQTKPGQSTFQTLLGGAASGLGLLGKIF